MEFKDRLATALEARTMKQVELSEKSGIPKSSISQYLKGVFVPKYDNAKKIADVLNINPEWLINGVGTMEYSAEDKYYMEMAETEGRYSDLRILAESMSAEQLKEFIRYGEYLLSK